MKKAKNHLTQDELLNYELTHDHAGNGFAMVQDIDEDYCRISLMRVEPNGKINKAFLAWKKKLCVTKMPPKVGEPAIAVKLTATRPFLDEILPEIQRIREGFAAGSLTVKDTHIIPAPKHKAA